MACAKLRHKYNRKYMADN